MHCNTLGATKWYFNGSLHTVVYKTMRERINWENKELKNHKQTSVGLPEINTMIKSIYRAPCSSDNYHQRSRQEQVIIFRLQTGHNKLNAHMNKPFRLISFPRCSCGEADQTAQHLLHVCKDYRTLRMRLSGRCNQASRNNYGPVGMLQTTVQFIVETGL
jgi:hypothetical protein